MVFGKDQAANRGKRRRDGPFGWANTTGHLTVEAKNIIFGLHLADATNAHIAAKFNVHQTTVATTIERFVDGVYTPPEGRWAVSPESLVSRRLYVADLMKEKEKNGEDTIDTIAECRRRLDEDFGIAQVDGDVPRLGRHRPQLRQDRLPRQGQGRRRPLHGHALQVLRQRPRGAGPRLHAGRRAAHRSKRTKAQLVDWPGYSPDLNPIEPLWSMIKARMNKGQTHDEHGGAREGDQKGVGHDYVGRNQQFGRVVSPPCSENALRWG